MPNSVISVENLGKKYILGPQRNGADGLRHALNDLVTLRRLRNGRASAGPPPAVAGRSEEFWALRDVSFEVKQGEVLGIIGRNGAGKSTLLKILSRITEPTTGRVRICGPVASLLEVGTGFHPELTGRENISLNGAILGMSKAEIKRKFDEIIAFAEIEKFLDTPVKRYSSGMYVRLAFAVAAHLEPEILLVDEVLAVGDAQFQKKCLGKMKEAGGQGRTLLFVSHNMTAVQALCPRALWLEGGAIRGDGAASDIVSDYVKNSFSTLSSQIWPDVLDAPGSGGVKLRSATVRPVDGTHLSLMTIRTPIVIEFEYWNLDQHSSLGLSLLVFNDQDTIVFNTASGSVWPAESTPAGLYRSACAIPGDLLNQGTHRATLLVVRDHTAIEHRFENVLAFHVQDVADDRRHWYGKWPGATRPKLKWETELVEETPALASLEETR